MLKLSTFHFVDAEVNAVYSIFNMTDSRDL